MAECVVGFWGVCARRLSVVVYAGIPRITKAGGAWNGCVPGPTRCMECCGGVLLSHTLPGAVPSALAGLASRFGMEAGRFPAAMTTTRWFNHIHFNAPVGRRVCRRGGLCWL